MKTITLHRCPTCQHLFWEHVVCRGGPPYHPPAETVAVEYVEVTTKEEENDGQDPQADA